jgi:hypothetical protein
VVTNVLLSVGVWLPMSCCPWVRGYQCLAVRGCLLSVATQPPIAAPNQRRVPQPPIADPQRRISQPTIAAPNLRRVPMGHVSIRNPLQAPKERSCGISIPSPSPGSAKRDRLSSSISYRMCKSPFGELYLGGGVARTHSCAALQLAVGFMI